jgi:hypothetical protein
VHSMCTVLISANCIDGLGLNPKKGNSKKFGAIHYEPPQLGKGNGFFGTLLCLIHNIGNLCRWFSYLFHKRGGSKKVWGGDSLRNESPPKQIQENNESKNTQYAYTNIISYFLLNANFFHGISYG